MIDIILPIPAANADLVKGFADSMLASTEAEFRVIAVLDGGTPKEIGQVQDALAEIDHVLMNNHVPVYLPTCLEDARKEVRQQFVVIARPEVRMQDRMWVAKISRIFQVDPQTCIIDTVANTPSTSLAPVKRQVHRPPDDGVRFAALSGRFFKGTMLAPTVDPVRHLAGVALRTGCSAWHHGGISYLVTEHKDHLIWREPSVAAAPSRSPSQTTPGSSTPTTTAKGGSTGFGL